MKLAIFGRVTENINYSLLSLLIDKLLEDKRVELCFYKPFYNLVKNYLNHTQDITFFDSYTSLQNDTDLILSMGGDGTFLESLTIVRNREIPIAGINFGRLGFLTTAKADNIDEWIIDLLAKHYIIEKRSLLHLESDIVPREFYSYALNEITLQRSTPVMLEIEVKINGVKLPKYWADGVVISSPTGSTAYSLSIGAPVVMPEANVFIIAPIAPHNLNVRPLIIPDTSVVEISYKSRQGDAIITLDNRFFSCGENKKLVLKKAKHKLKSVSINNNFIAALHQKLLLGEDKRNNF